MRALGGSPGRWRIVGLSQHVLGSPMNSGTNSVALVEFLSYVTRPVVQHGREVDMSLRENTILLHLESVGRRRYIRCEVSRTISKGEQTIFIQPGLFSLSGAVGDRL